MRGLLILSDPRHPQLSPELWAGEAQKLNMEFYMKEAAVDLQPPLLNSLRRHICRLNSRCDWVCMLAEGDCIAHALAIAAQLPVDRLILAGGDLFSKNHCRSLRRLNAFARRNLSLVTAEIIAAGMGNTQLHRLSSGLGWQSGGLIYLPDAAELGRKRESFLTASFQSLLRDAECAK